MRKCNDIIVTKKCKRKNNLFFRICFFYPCICFFLYVLCTQKKEWLEHVNQGLLPYMYIDFKVSRFTYLPCFAMDSSNHSSKFDLSLDKNLNYTGSLDDMPNWYSSKNCCLWLSFSVLELISYSKVYLWLN